MLQIKYFSHMKYTMMLVVLLGLLLWLANVSLNAQDIEVGNGIGRNASILLPVVFSHSDSITTPDVQDGTEATSTATTSSQTILLPATPEPGSTASPTLTPTPTIRPTSIPIDQASPTPTSQLQLREVRNFIFGHSLINHVTDSSETTVPYWLYGLAQQAGNQYAVDGQFGFLPQHANLPPVPNWGFEGVPGVWDVDSGTSFGESDFTTILLTAGNFIQYQPATEPYDGENPMSTTPLQATLDIIDWVTEQEPGIDIYIYENWPDMGGFLSAGFPPLDEEIAGYHVYTVGEFHQWWVGYLDALTAARPNTNIRMIPVGPIIAKLLTETELAQISVSELYEDDAPHGRPTIYFLASLITYMGIYGEKAPEDFIVPSTIQSILQDNYGTVVDFIWDELDSVQSNSSQMKH